MSSIRGHIDVCQIKIAKTFERSSFLVLLRSSVHGAAARRTGEASEKPTAETAKIHSVVQKMNFHAELVTSALGTRIKRCFKAH